MDNENGQEKNSSYLDLFGNEGQNSVSFQQKFDIFPTFSKALNRKRKNRCQVIYFRREYFSLSSEPWKRFGKMSNFS